MPEYTEAQIRELSGRDLRVAVSLLVLGDDLTAGDSEERLLKAVCSYRESLGIAAGLKWLQSISSDEQELLRDNWHLTAWDIRHGQPWQSDLEQHVANWRAEPLEMDLNWCVPELMGPGKVLGPYLVGVSYTGYDLVQAIDGSWSIKKYSAGPGKEHEEWIVQRAQDMATAILRAACLVALRENSLRNSPEKSSDPAPESLH